MLERKFNINQIQYDWPENFYAETDSATRKKYLDEAMSKDTSEENKLRLLLWQKRYTNSKGKITGYDNFMKIWTDMEYVNREKNSFFGKGKVKKFREEMTDVFQLNLLAEKPEYQEIWFQEFLNFCCFYIQISSNDKSYATGIFGLGKLADDTLASKMAKDLLQKSVLFPKELEIFEAQEIMADAAKQAYLLYFPGKEDLYTRRTYEA